MKQQSGFDRDIGGPGSWQILAEGFVAGNDYAAGAFHLLQRDLSKRPAKDQHDCWSKLAATFRQMNQEKLAFQCFVQSLVCSPVPGSDSWTQIRLSPRIEHSGGFVERLSQLPRFDGPAKDPALANLAADLQVRFGFPGA
ncbi:MAG: hypothetical protein QUS11_09055 [Candidatus Fermentibacter sp.]|nr:hypothetical protein [Candidatus Fermentibacter sp.]